MNWHTAFKEVWNSVALKNGGFLLHHYVIKLFSYSTRNASLFKYNCFPLWMPGETELLQFYFLIFSFEGNVKGHACDNQ